MSKKSTKKDSTLTLGSIRQTVQELFEAYGIRLEERILGRIETHMFEQRSDIATMKDEIVGELKTIREEQTILNGRSAKINDIEERVEKLEEIHPQSQHATS